MRPHQEKYLNVNQQSNGTNIFCLDIYTKEYPCIVASKVSAKYARCTVCDFDFVVSHGGRDDVVLVRLQIIVTNSKSKEKKQLTNVEKY